MPSSLAQVIGARLDSLACHDAASLHRLRRALSRQLAEETPEVIIATALELLDVPGRRGAKLIAYGLIGNHAGALRAMDGAMLERLGRGLASWGDVDLFCCLVAGRAWRVDAISDDVVRGWAKSKDRWWRRAALVATVPLNVRAQGGRGDPRRTLAVCRLLVHDRDDMVLKALSWALRELVIHDRVAVASFVKTYAEQLAPRVTREVKNKLATGLKNGRANSLE